MKTREELLNEIEKLCSNIREMLNAELNSSNNSKKELSDIEHQMWRSDTFRHICRDDSDEATVLEKKLDADPPLFKNNDIQNILDGFDWKNCVDIAKKLGYKYGFDESDITEEKLIEDALDMFRRAEDPATKCGRYQLGRLVVDKFYDFEEDYSWYTMSFFIEHGEAY